MKIRNHSSNELIDELERRRNEPLYEITKKFALYNRGEPVLIHTGTAKVYENMTEIEFVNFPSDQYVDGVVVGGYLTTDTHSRLIIKGYTLTYTVDRPAV